MPVGFVDWPDPDSELTSSHSIIFIASKTSSFAPLGSHLNFLVTSVAAMGKDSYNPDKEIPDLSGKVFLITGGESTPLDLWSSYLT